MYLEFAYRIRIQLTDPLTVCTVLVVQIFKPVFFLFSLILEYVVLSKCVTVVGNINGVVGRKEQVQRGPQWGN